MPALAIWPHMLEKPPPCCYRPSQRRGGIRGDPFCIAGAKRTAGAGQAALSERKSGGFMQIVVRENNVDQALRALKKKLQREGVYREMKLRRHYEKPSEKRARERAAAVRRARKMERKRLERDGVR
jgi:small subunit ribosomal protein S21